MAVVALITYDQQKAIRPISANRENNFDQWARDVQERDLKALLGVKLYQDLVNNPTDPKYVELLDGGTFTVGDFEYTQLGLRYVLAYFIYAEYSTDSQFLDTFAGFTKKNIPESDRASYGENKTKKKNNRLLAFGAFEEIKLFLDNNSTTYPYWDGAVKKKLFTPKVTKI